MNLALKSFTLILLTLFVLKQSDGVGQDQQSQTDSIRTLNDQFEQMIETSETYQKYKVIPQTRLNEMSTIISDTLKGYKNDIKTNQNTIESLKSEIKQVKNELANTQSDLKESEALNNQLVFLGIKWNKTVYHSLVWGLVAIFLGLAVFFRFQFIQSNKITKQTRQDYKELESQFKEHKDNAWEKEKKLKRELQTAINELEELKGRSSSV